MYCSSIKKLSALPAKIAVLSHNGVIQGNVRNHFQKALKATQLYHEEMLKRLAGGEDLKKISLEIARHVYTFTNMQPFEVIHGLTRVMMKRSQSAAGKENLFNM